GNTHPQPLFSGRLSAKLRSPRAPDDPALIRALVNLARCENMSGHANESEALARRAVELSSKMFGQAHVGDCTRNVGRGQRITPTAAQKTGAGPGETGKGLLAKQFRNYVGGLQCYRPRSGGRHNPVEAHLCVGWPMWKLM